MHTTNRIFISAPPRRVYDLAARIEEWPRLLRHYRYVDLLDPAVGRDRWTRLVKMGASRSGIPVSWTSLQYLDPTSRRIRYRHVGGVTWGMDVLWTLEPDEEGTLVTIEHNLLTSRWWLRPRVISSFVGTVFVETIAGRTLAGVKRIAEGRS